MSGPPQRPAPPEPAEKTGSVFPILMATGLGIAVVVALMFLTLGIFAYVLAAGLVLFLVAAFHYLVWGRWLERVIRAQVEEEDRLERERIAAQKAANQPPATAQREDRGPGTHSA